MKYALAALVSIPWIIVAITEYRDYSAEKRPVESVADVKKFTEVWREIKAQAEQSEIQSPAAGTPSERMGEFIGQSFFEFPDSNLKLYIIKTATHGTVAVHSALPIDEGTVVEVVKFVTIGSDKQPTEIYWAKEVPEPQQKEWRNMNKEKTPVEENTNQELQTKD